MNITSIGYSSSPYSTQKAMSQNSSESSFGMDISVLEEPVRQIVKDIPHEYHDEFIAMEALLKVCEIVRNRRDGFKIILTTPGKLLNTPMVIQRIRRGKVVKQINVFENTDCNRLDSIKRLTNLLETPEANLLERFDVKTTDKNRFHQLQTNLLDRAFPPKKS